MRVILALCFSIIANGRIVFQQRGGPNNYMTQVQVGTPPQTMDVIASFGIADMRLLDEFRQFPFLSSYNSGKSTSFAEGTDTLRFSDGHEIPEMSIHSIDFTSSSRVDQNRYDTGLAGLLGLSTNSPIASKYSMRFKSCPVSIRDKVVPGFTLDLEEPDSVAPIPTGVVGIAAPVKSDNGWEIDSSLSINGQKLFSGRNIHFEFDLSVDNIRLSRTVLSELSRTLSSQNFDIRTNLSSGWLKLKFPCDEQGKISTNQWIDFKLVLNKRKQVTINIPILGVGPRDEMGYCESVIEEETSGENIIGNLVLENRHSVIFDKFKKEIRFMDYYPFVPLNAALPPVPGLPAHIVVSHSIHPVVDETGLVRFAPTESDGGFVLRSRYPLRAEIAGMLQYLYQFFGPTMADGGPQSQFVVPGLFHVDDSAPGLLAARLDYETHQIVLPTRKATDISLPVYAIMVEVNGKAMIVRLERVEATADFDSLDIVINDEENIDECCICHTATSESQDNSVSVVNSCGHRFHTNCLRGWTNRKANCPVCRCQIPVKPNGNLRRIEN